MLEGERGVVVHDQQRDDELLAKANKLLEITGESGVSITPELAAFGARFSTEVGIQELLTLNRHPQREEMTLEDWIFLWKDWCLAREERAISSDVHDCAQAALARSGIDISLASQESFKWAGSEIEGYAAARVGLSTADALEIYIARVEKRDAARKTILTLISEKALPLHPRHRNWLCGFLRSHYPAIFPDVTAGENCPPEVWGEKVTCIVGTCLMQPAPDNFQILGALLKQALWLEEVALRSSPQPLGNDLKPHVH